MKCGCVAYLKILIWTLESVKIGKNVNLLNHVICKLYSNQQLEQSIKSLTNVHFDHMRLLLIFSFSTHIRQLSQLSFEEEEKIGYLIINAGYNKSFHFLNVHGKESV